MTSKVSVPCLTNPRNFLRLIGQKNVKLTWAANKDLMSMILMHMGPTAGRKVVNKLVENGKISWDENFEVEVILDHVVEKGTDYYLIKWQDWSSDYNTWEPKSHLVDCQDLLAEFHRRWNPSASAGAPPGPRGGRGGVKRLSSESTVGMQPESKKKRVQELLEHIMQYNDSLTALSLLEAWEADERCGASAGRPPARCVAVKARAGDVTNKRSKAYRTRKLEAQQALKAWQAELNRINTDPAGISVENTVDFEGPPHNFHYINDYMPVDGITIHSEPVVGCECSAGAGCLVEKNSCCSANAGSTFAYYATRRLRVEQGTPIYECNKRCRCGPDCPNRVVQNGRKHRVCIFRTDNGRGWGVKAMQPIKKGTFVMEYVGEVVTNEEAERRGKNYDAEGMTYLFDLDYQDTDCVYTVDAGVYGNVSHFVNHSCDPNLTVYVVWINNLDPRLPRIALFSARDIQRGEELTFDYLMTGDTTEGNEPELQQNMTENFKSLDEISASVNDTINSILASVEQAVDPSSIIQSCDTIPFDSSTSFCNSPTAAFCPLKLSNKQNITADTIQSTGDALDDVKRVQKDFAVAKENPIITLDLLTPENSQLALSTRVALDTTVEDVELDEMQTENIPPVTNTPAIEATSSLMKIQATLPPEGALTSYCEIEMSDEAVMDTSSNSAIQDEVRMDKASAANSTTLKNPVSSLPALIDTSPSVEDATVLKISKAKFGGDLIKSSVSSSVAKETVSSETSDMNGDPSFFKRSKLNQTAAKYRLMCQCGAKKCRKYLY